MLLALNGDNLRNFDDDGGAGFMSRMAGSINVNTERVVVAAWSTEGLTDLFVNDVSITDNDGDGLGIALESNLGLCDTNTGLGPSYCTGRNWDLCHDTDRDGLSDKIEVFGAEDGGLIGLHLPAWGADPLKKDIFIEQDFALKVPCGTGTDCWHPSLGGGATNPFKESLAQGVQSKLAEASEWEAGNTPGSGGGVRVHFDVGYDCTDQTLCGNWGGGGQAVVWPWDPDGDANHLEAWQFSSGRMGIFRYLVVFPNGGQTTPGYMMVRAGIKGFSATPTSNTVTHELGHSLGIRHGGFETINCGPSYRSIMNYALRDLSIFGFSHGTNPEAIDPGRVKEVSALSSDSAYLSDTSIMTHGFPSVAGAPFGSVDWNRSEALETPVGQYLRAGVSQPLIATGCAASAEVRSTVEKRTPGSLSQYTPDLIVYQGKQLVFYADAGQIKYRVNAHSGANGKGGCADGTGSWGEWGATGCNAWGDDVHPPHLVPLASTATVRGVRVAELNGKLYLAYTYQDTPTTSRAVVHMANGWATPEELAWPGGSAAAMSVAGSLVRDTEVELSLMYVDSTRDFDADSFPDYPTRRVLGLFGAAAPTGSPPPAFGTYTWWVLDETASTWSSRPLRTTGGLTLNARRAPGVTVWPTRETATPNPELVGFACGVFGEPLTSVDGSETRDAFRFYCYNRSTDRWDEFTSGPGTAMVGRRIGVAFHTFREAPPAIGDPAPVLNGDPSRGQFWISIVQGLDASGAHWYNRHVITKSFSASQPPTAPGGARPMSFPVSDWIWDAWSQTLNGAGVPLYEDGNMSALKGLFLSQRPTSDVNTTSGRPEGAVWDKLSFLPFVDGTFHHDFKDWNDFRIMERGICLGLGGARCGPPNSSGF